MTWILTVTSWGWLALEAGLIIRDRRQGRGSTARDRATRLVIVTAVVPAVLAATALSYLIPAHSPLTLPGAAAHPWAPVAGAVVMWAGLAVRIWAIATLGKSFRTTVEVDPGQAVVDHGPYRWVRHPSYTGILLTAAGYGLGMGNWVSLALLLVVPAAAMLRRIAVEEDALAETIGAPYRSYREHTRRLIPGLW